MSWFSKVAVFCGLMCPALWAQHISFNGFGSKANFQVLNEWDGRDVSSLELRFALPGLDLDRDGDGFDSVQIENLNRLQRWGAPALFTTGALIAVPPGFEPELTVVSRESKVLQNIYVQPSQPKFRCGNTRSFPFSFDSKLYGSNQTYPARPYTLEPVGHLQSLQLARVNITPLQMNMANHSLTVTTALTLKVSFRRTSWKTPVTLSPSLYALARSLAANGQGWGDTIVPAKGPETMMIVTADAYASTIQPLVEWKRSRGLNVVVVTFTQAGGTNEAVKAYLQKWYDAQSTKPTYLVFVGNKDSMPPFMESTSSGSAASDYSYSLLSGHDTIPDLFYGRIVADNADEVVEQINRWVGYEKNPEAQSWYSNGTTIASDQTSAGGKPDTAVAEEIATALKHGTYKNIDAFYEGKGNATVANISAALNEGRSWLTYIGHGGGTYWASTNDEFDLTSIANLMNGDKLPVLIDVACENASWVELPRCFGKAWVTQKSPAGKSVGAVGYYGGSVSISWDPPAVMATGIAKYHFEKSIPTLGGSVLAGQLYLIEKMGSGDNTLDNLKWYNLFGDPSLLMRTDTPLVYQLKQSIEKKEKGIRLSISALDASGKAVPHLMAAVESGPNLIAEGTTDEKGQLTLDLAGVTSLEPNTVLTTTGVNAETHQVLLQLPARRRL